MRARGSVATVANLPQRKARRLEISEISDGGATPRWGKFALSFQVVTRKSACGVTRPLLGPTQLQASRLACGLSGQQRNDPRALITP